MCGFYLEVLGYFLGDSKAILNGCADHWTLQERTPMPLLFHMTVCVHIRVLAPGAWVAFSYSTAHVPKPELGLEGDEGALYGWLLGVRHHFSVQLSPTHWHMVCLRRNVQGNSFSLEVDGEQVAERTVIARAMPPLGTMRLGCQPRDRPPGSVIGRVELYLFRVWADLDDHALCEDGSVIGWDSVFWGEAEVNCEKKQDIRFVVNLGGNKCVFVFFGSASYFSCHRQNLRLSTNCSVLLQFSQPVSTCSIRSTLQNVSPDLQLHLQGEVLKVGPGLCQGVESPAGDFVKCSSSTEDQLTTLTISQTSTDELLGPTVDASQLNSSQIAEAVGKLEKLLESPEISPALGQKAVNAISNLMGGDPTALSASGNRLIKVVDALAFKLAVTGGSGVLSSNSLALAVREVDGTNFPGASFSISNPADLQVIVRSSSRSRRSVPPLGSVVLPPSLTGGLSPEDQNLASRVQFTFYQTTLFFQDKSLGERRLISPVLGSSVANLSITNLTENVTFTLRNSQPVPGNYVASCVFWDFSLNGGAGGWSSAGCFLLTTTEDSTSCSCNHLTSFAILLDLSREGVTDRQQALILTFITYIGCGISAIFLSVTLLTYLSFQKLRRDVPSKILVQLCLSLFLLNMLFLLDGWLALYSAPGLCTSTAFLLHYFLLTSFTWAGLEAFHMYMSVVRVFTPYLSRYMLKLSLMGWGLPLIIVIVVISVDKDNYGQVTYGRYTDGTSDDFCWLRNDIAFYVTVVAYFLLVFVLCLLVFIVVLVQLARVKKQNPQNTSPHRSVMTDLRSIAGLIILLGLTWGFALFAWGPLYLPFVYLFSIFNSLQGFFIFVFHCAVKENVRRQWRTHLCCGSLRLAENSEWSRTATQNPQKLSVTTATTSAFSPSSRSPSVSSDVTNSSGNSGSSGSVLADSGTSDGSNADVVLNEIHSRQIPTGSDVL
ncbi:adhesion G-protein coupled receptor G2 [Aplochiton taeniatus]